MQELRDLARGELIGNFVENPPYSLSLENVSGVSLRIDNYWLAWFNLRFYLPPLSGSSELSGQRISRMLLGMKFHFDQRPIDWVEHCKRKGYSWSSDEGSHPVLIVVILRRPLQEIFRKGDYPRNLGPHPIVYDHRPDAAGYALACGDYLASAHEGTLGGFLWHQSDQTYLAVSCAHVLGKNSPKNRAYSPKPNPFGSKTEIGDVIWSQMPASATSAKCNSRADPNAPTVDAAYAVVDNNLTPNLSFPRAGKISQWTPIAQIGQGDPVTFNGYLSGPVRAKVKEATIWKEISLNGNPYCFKDIFVLEDSVFQYVSSPLAQKGDSGAWVVNSTRNVVSWDGMLIGGDGANAYCCYAENIIAAMNDSNVVLPP